MRHLFNALLSVICVGMVLAHAEPAPEAVQCDCEVWGQIVSPAQSINEAFTIELAGKLTPRQRVQLSHGNFAFRSVPAGPYQFRVFDGSGRLLFTRTKSLTGKDDKIILIAPSNRSLSQSLANTISFRELRHETPREVRNLFHASEKAMDAGETEKSIKYLQKALSIDPQLAEAHINLAAQYTQLGRDQEALEHFQSAVDLSPELPEAPYDLAMLLILTKNYQQAEAVARRGLEKQGDQPGLHAVLAASLLHQERNLDEAYDHLRLAAPVFPIARLLAAHALAAARRFTGAAAQVTEYLRTAAHPCERRELEGWLARIETLDRTSGEN